MNTIFLPRVPIESLSDLRGTSSRTSRSRAFDRKDGEYKAAKVATQPDRCFTQWNAATLLLARNSGYTSPFLSSSNGYFVPRQTMPSFHNV